MKEQLVPFLKSLVILGWEANPQPPGHKAHALRNEPQGRSAKHDFPKGISTVFTLNTGTP